MRKLICLIIIPFCLFILFGCSKKDETPLHQVESRTEEKENEESTEDLSKDLIGSWEITEDFGLSDKEAKGTDAKAFEGKNEIILTFKNDGKYTQTTETDMTYNDNTTENTKTVDEGSYTIDKNKIIMTLETQDGKTRQQIAQELGEEVSEADLISFDPQEITVEINGDKLVLNGEQIGTVEYSKVKE